MISRRLFVVVAVVLLAACGGSPAQQTAPPAATLAPLPTEAPLTADEQATMQLIAVRTGTMATAAADLQRLGQEIRATVAWKVEVRTAAQFITGGRNVLSEVTLPARFEPLKGPLARGTEQCATIAETLLEKDIEALTIATVKAQQEALKNCEAEMKRIQGLVERTS